MIHRLRYVFLTIVGLAILAALSGAAYQSIQSNHVPGLAAPRKLAAWWISADTC